MPIQCLSQQVQVNVLIALDLRQSQHCETAVSQLSAIFWLDEPCAKGERQGSATRSVTADN